MTPSLEQHAFNTQWPIRTVFVTATTGTLKQLNYQLTYQRRCAACEWTCGKTYAWSPAWPDSLDQRAVRHKKSPYSTERLAKNYFKSEISDIQNQTYKIKASIRSSWQIYRCQTYLNGSTMNAFSLIAMTTSGNEQSITKKTKKRRQRGNNRHKNTRKTKWKIECGGNKAASSM